MKRRHSSRMFAPSRSASLTNSYLKDTTDASCQGMIHLLPLRLPAAGVNHVSEHPLMMSPVYTGWKGESGAVMPLSSPGETERGHAPKGRGGAAGRGRLTLSPRERAGRGAPFQPPKPVEAHHPRRPPASPSEGETERARAARRGWRRGATCGDFSSRRGLGRVQPAPMMIQPASKGAPPELRGAVHPPPPDGAGVAVGVAAGGDVDVGAAVGGMGRRRGRGRHRRGYGCRRGRSRGRNGRGLRSRRCRGRNGRGECRCGPGESEWPWEPASP